MNVPGRHCGRSAGWWTSLVDLHIEEKMRSARKIIEREAADRVRLSARLQVQTGKERWWVGAAMEKGEVRCESAAIQQQRGRCGDMRRRVENAPRRPSITRAWIPKAEIIEPASAQTISHSHSRNGTESLILGFASK